jgi:hypothetical protein
MYSRDASERTKPASTTVLMAHHPTRVRLGSGAARLTFCLSTLLLVSGIPAPPYLLAQDSQQPDKLTYTKVLKGSVPEYQSITVDANGVGAYVGRKLDESPRPRALKLSASTTRLLFQLAHALNDFRSVQLESHKKVANMGQKTLIYERNGQENKVEFNYTLDRRAQELVDLFEGVCTVEQHIGVLEFSARYDHLSLPGELSQVEIDLANKALVDPELMAPILQKIADNSQFLHIAQKRAKDILDRMQDSK